MMTQTVPYLLQKENYCSKFNMTFPRPFTCSLVILSLFTRSGTIESSEVNDAGIPEFSWIDEMRIQVLFPDESRDIVALRPADNIAGMDVPYLYEGTLREETGGDVVVSGCKDQALVSITIHSNRLIGRTMFDVRDNLTQEIQNPYANGDLLREVYDDDEAVQRSKRDVVFEDYVLEDYDEDYSFDGIVPPRLKMNTKLGFEESLKTHLGGEDAARDYVAKVFVHGRSYMKHKSLGTSLTLNLAEPPIYVPNKHWKARRSSMAEAKRVKTNEAVPIIYFCFDGDDDNFMGVSRIRRACDTEEGVGIAKYRANIQVAANTYAHEQGHLVGLKHDKEEDIKKANGNQDSLCHGHGLMSEIAPAGRPEKFTACNAQRFKSWYHNFGSTCLMEVNIPETLKSCPYPPSFKITACKCMTDTNNYDVFLFCKSFDQDVASNLADNFECRKKIHKLEVNMHKDDLQYLGGLEDIGALEIEYFHLYNVSKITANFEADVFKGSKETIKEIKIEQLPKLEKGRGVIRTGSFSNLVALENVELGEDSKTIETKAFSGLPSIVNLKIEGVENISTNAFFDMTKLVLLDLSCNSLSSLPSSFIQNAPTLSTINLSYNSLTNLSINVFQNLPSLAKLILNNNKIASIHSGAMTNLPKLQLLDLSHNPLEEMGTCLDTIKNKDLIVRLNGTQISLLREETFKAYVETVVSQGGRGYVDVDLLELDCGCDIKWMFIQQHSPSVAKFYNALCKDGHTLEQTDTDMLEGFCSSECMAKIEPAVWELGLNINPCDGHNFGYGGPWSKGVNVGTSGQAFSRDFIDINIWKKPARFITIARHVNGQCTMSKTWQLKDKTRSMYSYFATYPGRIYATGDGSRTDNHIAEDIPSSAEGLTGTWRDPIFGADGGLVFNWYYSNNGARVGLPGGYKTPYTLPSTSLTHYHDDFHGLGNEFGADTKNGRGSSAWWHDVAKIGPGCSGSGCQVVGTDRGSSINNGPCWGSYAIFVSQDAKSFNCQGRSLSTTMN